MLWLIQPTSALPPPPHTWLSANEQARYAGLQRPKRRADWVLGRWTAKQLFRAYLAERTGQVPALETIEIRNASSGAPYAVWHDQPLPPLTISHGHEYAFCAMLPAAQPQASIGADLEKVEARHPLFLEDYFTPYEQAQVAATPPAWRDTLLTALWSAKEAALKVVQRGLTLDTRSVECRIPPLIAPPNGWAEFAIDWHQRYLPQPFPPLTGWWRVWGELVLTIACDVRAAN